FSSGAGRTSDGNGSHASTLKSPSYTKSVSWQHHLPLKQNSRTCYLSWHEAAGRDKGHQWMEEQLVSICKR
ncbi:TPA: hypothetical protein ACQ8WD_000257, partial [Escherichia coli]